jgi:hypothetical protein
MLSPELAAALGIVANNAQLDDRLYILGLAINDEMYEKVEDLPSMLLQEDVMAVMMNG